MAGQGQSILHSELVGLVSCLALVWMLGRSGRPALGSAIGLALAAWVAGPVAVLATDQLWIKMDVMVPLGHSVEWLVRFLTTAVLASVLLEKSKEA